MVVVTLIKIVFCWWSLFIWFLPAVVEGIVHATRSSE